jgi:putative redox protein
MKESDMSEVTVTWVEKVQYVGVDSNKHGIVMSAQNEENRTGSKPSDLLLLALGGCAGVDLIEILQKQRQKVIGLQMHISGEQNADPPWAFNKIHMEIVLRGKGLSAQAVERAIDLAVNKYCSVAATIRACAPITTSFRLVEE